MLISLGIYEMTRDINVHTYMVAYISWHLLNIQRAKGYLSFKDSLVIPSLVVTVVITR